METQILDQDDIEVVSAKEIRHKHFFIDEAGDPNLFDKHHKRVIVGTTGCSRYLILGMLDVPNPDHLSVEMEALRSRLCLDPRFPTEPTSSTRRRDTAKLFHAKCDHPAVRHELYSLLLQHDVRFFAAVTDKMCTVEHYRRLIEEDPTQKYRHEQEYDFHVRCLLSGRVLDPDSYYIRFASRGSSDRSAALEQLIKDHREWQLQHYGKPASDCVFNVRGMASHKHCGLQATDYMLWALQRFYEHHNPDYLEFVWPKCALINDRDLKGKGVSGRFFHRKDPDSLKKLIEARGDIGASH